MLDDPLIPLNGATGAAAVIKRTLWEPRAKNDAKVSLGQAYIDGCAVVGCRLGNVFEYIGRADSGCATDGVLGSLRR
ncbi:hypothetical protein [Rhodococcus sp. ARC_M6]|uniref:hypothetical protein n=1 Tax=Rhodococcus sp. ARC_M6 TaxID=2928852 RepID=UPI001FB29643|nr:hypothetical protein [Rhodococcus sp. ARC_M6]MCJ0902968.1 hypothetical protein [Rhodococcus sp. ARC_M6]